MTSLEEALRDLMIAKATELFEAYGVPCRVADATAADDLHVCGVLGFFGSSVCGTVVVAISAAALARSNPIGHDFDRRWSAELTNQLVGRFKNELLRRGVEVSLSLPIVLSSACLMPTSSIRIVPIDLIVGDGNMRIWLEVEGRVHLAAAAIESVPREGDVLIF